MLCLRGQDTGWAAGVRRSQLWAHNTVSQRRMPSNGESGDITWLSGLMHAVLTSCS